MDLISIESQQEQDFLGRNMARAGVREIWTSGRLCDKEVTLSQEGQALFYVPVHYSMSPSAGQVA
jgi:hypothetical protein